MPQNKKLAAVIVTYNRLDKLKKAIAATLKQEIDYVVVLNNCSTDGTQAWLDKEATKDSRLHVIHSEKNTGGAGGFHDGTKYAVTQTDADWVVLFDDDAHPQPGLVSNFHQLTPAEDVGAMSAAVYTPDDKIADFNRPGRNPFVSLGSLLKYFFSGNGCYLDHSTLQNSNAIEVDFSSFVGCFVRTSLIREQLGLPRREFFIYCDDWLYTLEISKLGYRNLYYSDLAFYHDSVTFVDSYDKQLWKQYYAIRNSLHFYKLASGIVFPLVFCLKVLNWLTHTLRYENKGEYLTTMWRAIKDGLNFTVPEQDLSQLQSKETVSA